MIDEEEWMNTRAPSRQGYTYAEIGRLVGRDSRTVTRYPSKLDRLKPLIDQWLSGRAQAALDQGPSGPGP